MTLPVLVQKNNNRVVETRLMKFYSAINQAVKMAEVDYGDKKFWWEDLAGAEIDKDGNSVPGSSEAEKWFNKYIAPYMKIIRIESGKSLVVYFPDGSALRQDNPATTRDWEFFIGNPDKCLKNPKRVGVCSFLFNFVPVSDTVSDSAWKYHVNKGFEPWKYNWDGSIESLKSSCYTNNAPGSILNGQAYCTAIIQLNGWKIPDDYPYKVSY